MDERKLGYFLAVVEQGSVTGAAAQLRVAQPSLSQALRALEAELGAELFTRVGRGMRLSVAGRELVGPVRQALRAMEEIRATVSGVAELLIGRLELAALATLAVDPMAGLIGRFREQHPGIEVHVQEPESAERVSAMVQEGACELGATDLPLASGGLLARPLGEQELLFVLPPRPTNGRRRALDARPLRPRELAETPLVVSPPGTSTRTLLEQALGAVGVTPRIAVEIAAREAIVPLVLSGAGAALLPAPLAREAHRRGAMMRAARPAITRRIGLIYRERLLSAPARAFLELADGERV